MGEQWRYRLRSAILLAALFGLPAWAIIGNPWESTPDPGPSARRETPIQSTARAPIESNSAPTEPVSPPASRVAPEAPQVAQAAFAEDSTATHHAVPSSVARTAADEYAQRASHGAYRWQEIQHRLRELGATYYLLETWGPGGEQFRFHCQVAVAGNSSYARSFEAVGANALEAMEEVLQQVELWRAGDTP